VIEEVTKWRRL